MDIQKLIEMDERIEARKKIDPEVLTKLSQLERDAEIRNRHERAKLVAKCIDQGKFDAKLRPIAIRCLEDCAKNADGEPVSYGSGGAIVQGSLEESFRSFLQNLTPGVCSNPSEWEGRGSAAEELDHRARARAKADGLPYDEALRREADEDLALKKSYLAGVS